MDPLEWAERYRWLSAEDTAEKGKFCIERTPYMEEPMKAFADQKIWKIAIAASAQVAKTTLLTNLMGYCIDINPGPMLYVMPSDKDSLDFSMSRFDPMVRDCPRLRNRRIRDAKSRDGANTRQIKMFAGGSLKFVGTNVPNALAGKPVKYVFGDEIDRMAKNVGGTKDGKGGEGDPRGLMEARTITYRDYGAKVVYTSTPTVKGMSAIEEEFLLGTMERWKTQCPNCGEFHEIVFEDIHRKSKKKQIGDAVEWTVSDVVWRCPDCGFEFTEARMRKQASKWVAENPDALERGVRSFWLNAFASPWTKWESILVEFLQAEGNPRKLQTVFNTLLGKLWEERGSTQTEHDLLSKREDYGKRADVDGEIPADLPEGVLALTCGVDIQGDRLEYEVVGWGPWNESWGIKYGVIPHPPNEDAAWEQFDALLARSFYFKDGKSLRVAACCIDSGWMTREIYRRVYERRFRGVAAIKGDNGPGKDFIPQKHKRKKAVDLGGGQFVNIPFYALGVDEGKSIINYNLSVQQKGMNCCHFPLHESAGYDYDYFSGLLSERYEFTNTSAGVRGHWVKITGHERNEPLDCRNYAMAAYMLSRFDFGELKERLRNQGDAPRADATSASESSFAKRNTEGQSGQSTGRDIYESLGYDKW